MRYRFGLKELFFVLIGTGLTAILGNVNVGFTVNSCRVIQPEAIVTATFAMLSGPIVGGLVGFLGYIMSKLLSGQVYFLGWAIANMIVGIGIGIYAEGYGLREGCFKGGKVALFNMIQLIANGGAFLLLYPLAEMFMHGTLIRTALQTGIALFIINSLIIGFAASLLGLLYSAMMHVKKKDVKKQKDSTDLLKEQRRVPMEK